MAPQGVPQGKLSFETEEPMSGFDIGSARSKGLGGFSVRR
jgi:hypothetical protein